ncbi:armadillo-type protein [Mycena pura]|uniref:Armadillo-type protein n=1 Tax=Mycena pura TaxID=153505 RepID=A0AAD6V7L5_9AGAR|nr:armadillo-type protein [Mycena pura]
MADDTTNDTARELAVLEFLQEHFGDSDPAFKHFADSYAGVVDAVMDARLATFSRRFTAQAAYLTASAGIASLLASVQIAFVPLVPNPDCGATPTPDGCDPHSRLLRNLIILFSYVALSFDTLGALFSLFTARKLLSVSSHAQDLLGKKATLEKKILRKKGFKSGSDLFQPIHAFATETETLLEQVHRHQHVMEQHTGGLRSVISFILAGMLFFFAALVIQMVISQPFELWIVFILAMTTMASVLGWSGKRTFPGVWVSVRRRIYSKTREVDEEATLETTIRKTILKETTKQKVAQMLKDGDPNVKKRALNIMSSIFKDVHIRLDIEPSQMFHSIEPMLADSDPILRQTAVKTVISLVQDDYIRNKIFRSILLPRIASMLQDVEYKIRKSGLELIANLAQYSDCRAEIEPSNVGGMIILMLDDSNVRGSALEVVSSLAQHDYASDSTKNMIQKVVSMLQEPQSEIERHILDIIISISQHSIDRMAVSTPEILQKIATLIGSANFGVQVAALKALGSLVQHDDVATTTFTQEMIKQILSTLKDCDDAMVRESALGILSAILRRGRLSTPACSPVQIQTGMQAGAPAQAPGPSSIILVGDGTHSGVRECLQTIIRATGNLSSISDHLAQAAIEQADGEIVQCAMQLMIYFAENVESRYQMLNSAFCARMVDLLNDPYFARQAVLMLSNLAKYDDTRPKIVDPVSGIVDRLVQIINDSASNCEHWEAGIQGLLSMRREVI